MAIAESKQRKSYRLLWKFWLDVEKPEESTLSDYCGELKEQRRYSGTIRDALRLIRDLRNQQLSVLFELFPWVNAWLEERAQAIAEATLRSREQGQSGGSEGTDVKALQASIERLEMALLQQQTHDALQAARFGDDRNPRLLPPPVSPVLPDIEVSSATQEQGRVYANYMSSLSSFSSQSRQQKPRKVSIQEPPIGDQDARPIAPVNGGTPRLIQGANMQFAAPNIDDLSVDF